MTPGALLDAVKAVLDIERDAELARLLRTDPAQLSKVRAGKRRVGYALRVEIARATNWRMQHIDKLAGTTL